LIIKVAQLVSPDIECGIFELRSTNILVFVFLYFILKEFNTILHGSESASKRALIQVTFPPVVFFTFFFYTDNGSLLTILTFLLLTFKERLLSSCLFGIIALFFRQTSLIWIFFATCISILYQKSRLGQTIRTVDKELLATGLYPFVRYNWDQVIAAGTHVIFGVFLDWQLFKKLMGTLLPLIISGLFFCIFLVVNGSIVLGDKDAHQASFNPLQMSYFCLFTCVFISPVIIFDIFRLIKYLWKNKLWFICLTLLIFLLTKFFTVVHPYNLADNRHLVFYAWRLMSKMRWYLVPIYSVSIMITIFYLPKSFLFQLAFWLCTALVLIPQRLFEFRYFMVPFVIFDIFGSHRISWLHLIANLSISAAVFTIFARKEILWEDEENIQRMFW